MGDRGVPAASAGTSAGFWANAVEDLILPDADPCETGPVGMDHPGSLQHGARRNRAVPGVPVLPDKTGKITGDPAGLMPDDRDGKRVQEKATWAESARAAVFQEGLQEVPVRGPRADHPIQLPINPWHTCSLRNPVLNGICLKAGTRSGWRTGGAMGPPFRPVPDSEKALKFCIAKRKRSA